MPKNAPVIKDWAALGMLVGIGASAVKTMANYALHRAGLPIMPFTAMASDAMLARKGRFGFGKFKPHYPRKPEEIAVGLCADTLLGGIFGAGLSYLLAKSPPGNELFKGATYGAGLWLLTIGMGNHLKLTRLKKMSTGQLFTLLAMNMLFGGIVGRTIGKCNAQLLAQSHPALVKEVGDKKSAKGILKN